MPSEESILREQYTTLLSDFVGAFPRIKPPDPTWWFDWMKRYDCGSIHEAIETLGQHPAKLRFSTESTCRAISALLRQIAMRRALSLPVAPGGSHE